MDHQVLFVCTGNYYRSRYAEILFNHIADQYRLQWRSFSRGFQDSTREAPISPNAIRGLKGKGIQLSQVRYPIKLSTADLVTADHIFLMDALEHRPMMETHFPQWMDLVNFWDIRDVDFVHPKVALPQLDRQIDLLIGNLEMQSTTPLWAGYR